MKRGESWFDCWTTEVRGVRYDQLRQTFNGAIRYIAGGRGGNKEITPSEVQALHDHGLGIQLVWQIGGVDWTRNGGSMAREANDQAASLGYPKDCVIHVVAQDTGLNATNIARAVDYVSEWAAAARHPVSVYAGSLVFERALDRGAAQYAWQAGALSWSDWRISPRATVVQQHQATVGGVVVDFNTVQHDAPSWLPGQLNHPSQEDKVQRIVKEQNGGAYYLTDGVVMRWVQTGEDLAALRGMQPPLEEVVCADGTLHHCGALVGPVPPEWALRTPLSKLVGPTGNATPVLPDSLVAPLANAVAEAVGRRLTNG